VKKTKAKALVIDGYNAIYKIAYIEKMLDRDLRRAREEITKLAKEYKRKNASIERLCVVFDGKDAYRDGGFRLPAHQVFSRTGKGDEEIIRIVKSLSDGYHVLVVTDDNYIRNNSCAHKATVLSVAEFISGIREKSKKIDETVNAVNKVDSASAIKINEEMRKHWNV